MELKGADGGFNATVSAYTVRENSLTGVTLLLFQTELS